jgi:hypothetical protein
MSLTDLLECYLAPQPQYYYYYCYTLLQDEKFRFLQRGVLVWSERQLKIVIRKIQIPDVTIY